VAPSLHFAIREALQRKEVPPENIDLYLKEAKNVQRYDSAFRKLWAFSTLGGGSLRACLLRKLPVGF
jgi:hypothetical protein